MNKVSRFLFPLIFMLTVAMSLTAQAMKTPVFSRFGTGSLRLTPNPTIPTRGPDNYETDDDCVSAKSISTVGFEQDHNFHTIGNEDWIKFDATAGDSYQLVGTVDNSSNVDLSLELYDACNALVIQRPRYGFSSGVKMLFSAPATGTFYLKLTNDLPMVEQTNYQFSVRKVDNTPEVRATNCLSSRPKLLQSYPSFQ